MRKSIQIFNIYYDVKKREGMVFSTSIRPIQVPYQNLPFFSLLLPNQWSLSKRYLKVNNYHLFDTV